MGIKKLDTIWVDGKLIAWDEAVDHVLAQINAPPSDTIPEEGSDRPPRRDRSDGDFAPQRRY